MFDNIILFTKVIENNGFNKTAELENMSNSTLSRKIKELEDFFNKQLLIRNTRSFIVTPEGQELYNKFKDAVPRLNKFLANNSTISATKQINVVLPVVVSLEIFTPYLNLFTKKNPDIEMNVYYFYDKFDLHKNNIDVAVSVFPSDDHKNYDQRLIFKEIVQLYCTPEYARKYGIPDQVEELYSHNFIGGIDAYGYHEFANILAKLDGSESIALPIDNQIKISNLIHAYTIGIHHDHIFPCWNYFCDPKVENGELVKVLPDYFAHKCDFYLMTRRNLSKHAQKFVDFIYQCVNNTIQDDSDKQTARATVSDLF